MIPISDEPGKAGFENIVYKTPSSQPFPKRQILDASKLKVFTDDNFKFDEMVQSSLKG